MRSQLARPARSRTSARPFWRNNSVSRELSGAAGPLESWRPGLSRRTRSHRPGFDGEAHFPQFDQPGDRADVAGDARPVRLRGRSERAENDGQSGEGHLPLHDRHARQAGLHHFDFDCRDRGARHHPRHRGRRRGTPASPSREGMRDCMCARGRLRGSQPGRPDRASQEARRREHGEPELDSGQFRFALLGRRLALLGRDICVRRSRRRRRRGGFPSGALCGH